MDVVHGPDLINELAVFYHAWADGAWHTPLAEFTEALYASELTGARIGVVGTPANRETLLRWIAAHDDVWSLEPVVEADCGYEAVTLETVHEYAKTHDGAVLYAHTKGSAEVGAVRDRWRRVMTQHVVRDWRENADLLADLPCPERCAEGVVQDMVATCCERVNRWGECCGQPVADWQLVPCSRCEGRGFIPGAQAVGCHWLTVSQYPNRFMPEWTPAEGQGYFGGNFWMARCDYLRELPPVEHEPRYGAEFWIGLKDPRVVDLLPIWPT